MVTKSKREANNKWDKENMSVIACKIKNDIAISFKQKCKIKNTTPNAIFREAIIKFLSED